MSKSNRKPTGEKKSAKKTGETTPSKKRAKKGAPAAAAQRGHGDRRRGDRGRRRGGGLMSSEINAPADALSLIRTMQAANAALDAAAEALRKSTGLSAQGVFDHGDLVWGLDGHDDASRGVLYAQVRAGEELLFETSVESFQEIDDTHAVVIEWDPECGNALHLLRRDKRDDAAAAKRAADAWKAEEDRMMRDSMMGREGTVTP